MISDPASAGLRIRALWLELQARRASQANPSDHRAQVDTEPRAESFADALFDEAPPPPPPPPDWAATVSTEMLLQLTRKVVAPRPLNRAAAADRYRTHANGQYQVTANVNEVA